MTDFGAKYQPGYGGGWLPYVNLDGQWPTYAVVLSQVALPGPGVFLALTAPPTLSARILRVKIGPSVATAAGVQAIQLLTCSAAPSGGTPATATPTSFDSVDSAATAVVKTYIAGVGTVGTTIATLRSEQLIATQTTPTFGPGQILWEFGNGRPGKTPRLYPGQFSVLTCNAALAGQKVDLEIEWAEMPLGGGEV